MTNLVGLIAEDDSDVDVVDELIKKVSPNTRYSIKKFVGHGCGKILDKSLQWANNLKARGCTILILVHDLDTKVLDDLCGQLRAALRPCPIEKNIIVVPIREIEAWLLSDNEAIQRAMNLEDKVPRIANPQAILNPKEKLKEIVSLKSRRKKHYINAVHNRKIASELDLNNVRRCSSFVPLENFLSTHMR